MGLVQYWSVIGILNLNVVFSCNFYWGLWSSLGECVGGFCVCVCVCLSEDVWFISGVSTMSTVLGVYWVC